MGDPVPGHRGEVRSVWTRLPFSSIDTRAPARGDQLRINFYRLRGPRTKRATIAWQPTDDPSFHTPEAFGRLVLEGARRRQ